MKKTRFYAVFSPAFIVFLLSANTAFTSFSRFLVRQNESVFLGARLGSSLDTVTVNGDFGSSNDATTSCVEATSNLGLLTTISPQTLLQLWDQYSAYVKQYRSENGETWVASSVEYARSIYLTSPEKYGVYVDFDGGNGYLVACDSTVYDASSVDDFGELRDTSSKIEYSSVDGFVSCESNGSYEPLYSTDSFEKAAKEGSLSSEAHDGQLGAGDGEIYNLDAYVTARYGNMYSFVSKYYLRNYDWSNQFDTSVFRSKDTINGEDIVGGATKSEANCTPNAIYSVLHNLPTLKTYGGLFCGHNPSLNPLGPFRIDYSDDVSLDSDYQVYGTKTTQFGSDEVDAAGNIHKFLWRVNDGDCSFTVGYKVINHLPILYMHVRAYAKDHGYNPANGLSFLDIPSVLGAASSCYGDSIATTLFSTSESAIANINYGIPSLIGVCDSETYHSHCMAVYGYAKYSYIEVKNGVSVTKYRYFWAVDSGWGPGKYNGAQNRLLFKDSCGDYVSWFDSYASGGLSAFVTINRSSLIISPC